MKALAAQNSFIETSILLFSCKRLLCATNSRKKIAEKAEAAQKRLHPL
jgi:hypothetical protein